MDCSENSISYQGIEYTNKNISESKPEWYSTIVYIYTGGAGLSVCCKNWLEANLNFPS